MCCRSWSLPRFSCPGRALLEGGLPPSALSEQAEDFPSALPLCYSPLADRCVRRVSGDLIHTLLLGAAHSSRAGLTDWSVWLESRSSNRHPQTTCDCQPRGVEI